MKKIKICGLSRMEDIEAVNRYLPDYIGFVFYQKSKRYVTKEQAKILKQELDKRILAVGVFVDEDPAEIEVLVKEGIIDMIQLHGRETEETILRLKATCQIPIIKAFYLEEIRETAADFLLLDSGMGSGIPFDWSKIPQIEKPFFLAGGLNCDNIKEAMNIPAYALDLSSGVESNGVKDAQKIAKVMAFFKRRGIEQ